MSASTQKMPRPMSRDVPKFDSNEPENLCRFLGQMEDLFSDYSITDNDEKKKLVRYTDARTEEEWQALEEYDNGTFTEFKEAVLKNYPEAADAETGTWERLTCISCKFSNLGADECESYLKFKRRFLTEAKKLQKPPALVTNRELVEKFTDGSGIKAEFEEVKQQVATLLDRIDVSEKQAKERQEQILRAFQQGGNKSSSSRQPRLIMSASTQKMPRPMSRDAGPSDNCWYDWKPGHFIRDCQNVQKHVAEGLLKLVDRKFMMANGTPIPCEPAHLCPMDCMLATLSKRQEQMFWEDVSGPAGVFNISLPDNTSLYANKPRDARDEVIDKLRQDLQYWQTSARVPMPVQPALQPQLLQAPVASTSSQPMNQPFDPNVFLNQMRSLFSQAGSQNVTSNQNFEGQYAVTRASGGDASQQGFERV
ncbi:hypothetical protein ARMSODRAFT_888275 [Armillaria solidipes]|uniref:Uncharacterized protein n=1 Tax=Armillaria solidipes TaxID=1076256 RepID=A0A2H3BQ13_9AGAR|nr:hypothetical protein ARMSODRAFT_888275 [Armillaria solidipes]